MASTHKHIRSSTANKRPTTAIADGQIALNTNSASPGLFFKDSTGATIIKIGPVHVGATAPNASPAAGGSAGNSTGEIWLDNSLTPVGVKIWNGSAWVNATPIGSTTVQGLLELATDAETQAGSDNARAVTPASLQSKVSDSTSTTSSTTIASSTAVKAAYDLANAALPKAGGTITGNLEIGTTGSLSFEGSTADGFETTIAVVDPTADRTITLPNTTGTVVTTGDTGTVTSTMLADGTIVNADINSAAAIAGTKISPDFGSQTITTSGLFSHALGTAGAPTITFTGDINTGIYSPGADQVAISTNGTGRLFVNADGSIDLGTTTGSATPTVKAVANPVLSFSNGTNSAYVGLVGVNNRMLNFSTNGTTLIQSDSAINLNVVGSSTFTVGTSNTERLRVTSAGLVGIGTSNWDLNSVNTKMGVRLSGTTGDGISLLSQQNVANQYVAVGAQYDNTNTNNGSQIRFGIDSAGDTFSMIAFATANGGAPSEKMRLDRLGRLGIGTTSPSEAFTLGSGNAQITSGQLTVGVTSTSGLQLINDGTFGTLNSIPLVLRTASTERARIDTSGRLLVGTSSGSALLQVNGTFRAGDQATSGMAGNNATILSATPPSGALAAEIHCFGKDYSTAGANNHVGLLVAYWSADTNTINTTTNINHSTGTSQGFEVIWSSPNLVVRNKTGMSANQSARAWIRWLA